MEVRGRDWSRACRGRSILVRVMEAIEVLQQLVAAIRTVLEQTPPETSSTSSTRHGHVGRRLAARNIDKLLTQVTGVRAASPRTR